MFCAVFGAAARPERIRFLHEVKDAFPEEVEFVAFNTSGTLRADFMVVNAAAYLNPAPFALWPAPADVFGTPPLAYARPRMQIDLFGPRTVAPDDGHVDPFDADVEPLDMLRNLLEAQCPNQTQILIDHARGELGFGMRAFDRAIRKHVRMIVAFCRALDKHAPGHVYLWNQFNVLHRTFEAILKRRGIGVGFFHDGVLPDSIALDVDGEMGESWIARQPEKLTRLRVTNAEITRAAEFIRIQTGAENSRHPQVEHISVVRALELSGFDDRPVLFFAGQNDWHAGLKPKSPARAFHSPFFAGSIDALAALDKIAGEMGIAVLFKPHPLSRDRFAFLRAHDFPNTLILQHTSMNACLDACDVAATIASQTCYVALQEGLPVVMLGRNQLTGKGLTYDVTSIGSIRETIELAMEDPLRPSRARDLAVHAAQLEKAYLFDYGTRENDFYTRGAADFARLINLSIDRPVEEVIDTILAGKL